MDQVKEAWIKLYGESIQRSVLSSHRYAELWYRWFSSDKNKIIYKVSGNNELLGIVPFDYRTRFSFKIFNSLTSDTFPYYVPLINNDHEKGFRKEFLKALYQDRRFWDIVIYQTSYSFSEARDPFLDGEMISRYFKCDRIKFPTYCIKIEGTFEEYLKGLRRKVKKNINYLRNLYRKSGTFALKHFTGKDAVDLWPVFKEIENSGWKERAGTSIQKVSEKNSFFDELNNLLAEEGVLNLFLLMLNGEYIAGEWAFVENGVLHALKSGYKEKYKELSPSNFLFFLIIEALFGIEGIHMYHMFPGGDQYKHRFVNTEQFVAHTYLFSPTVKGHFAYHLYQQYKRIKAFKRKYLMNTKGIESF